MTRYFTNWEEDGNHKGSAPPNWTNRWDTTNIAYSVAFTFPTTWPGVFKRRELLFNHTGGAGPYAISGISFDLVDADANRHNVEVVTRVRTANATTSTGATRFLVFVRGAGDTAGTAAAYAATIGFSGDSAIANTVRIQKVSAGTATDLATASKTINAPYYVRFRAQDSGGVCTLSLKVWLDSTEEPSAWDVTTTDATYVGVAGWVAAGVNTTGVTGGAVMNFFSVATNGDSAHRPVSDSEYLAWLSNQTAVRRTLVEMAYNGYDADATTDLIVDVPVYIADGGFTSQDLDDPPSTNYRPMVRAVPTFSKTMGIALSGKVENGFGRMLVANPVATQGAAGDRDDWARYRWKRDYVRMFLGDDSWPKCDFRCVVLGRLAQPTCPSQDTLEFGLADLAGLFDAPILTNTGSNNQAFKPKVLGWAVWIDLVPIDSAARTFQLHDGTITNNANTTGTFPCGSYPTIPQLYDNGVPLFYRPCEDLTYTVAWDHLTDTFTFNSSGTPTNHGLQNGSMIYASSIYFGVATPPELSLDTVYYVVNRTTTTFQLAATSGGAAINFSSSSSSSAGWIAYGYGINFTTGVATLGSNPTTPLRITAAFVATNDTFVGLSYTLSNLFNYSVFTLGGISADFRDQDSFNSLATAGVAGIYLKGDKQTSIRDALSLIAQRSNTWFQLSPDGLMQVGLIGLPASTAKQSFLVSDVEQDSLRLTQTLRPIDFSTGKAIVYCNLPNLNAPLAVRTSYTDGSGNLVQRAPLITIGSIYSAVPPIDNNPTYTDVRLPHPEFEIIYNDVTGAATEKTRLTALFLKTLGIFEFYTRLPAAMLNIGDTISLTHPRLGWKSWNVTDPASPDNTATIDSRLAVVIGVDVDLSRDGPFKVKLTVFRQIPSNYPSSSPAGGFSLEEDSSICLREDGTYEYEEY